MCLDKLCCWRLGIIEQIRRSIKIYSSGVLEQFNNIIGVFFSSQRTFLRLKSNPSWLVTFLLIAAGTILISFIISPFVIQAQIVSFPSEVGPQQIEDGMRFIKRYQTIVIFLSPLFLIIKFLVNSAILWLIVQLFREADFKRVFSLVVHCALIQLLGSIVSLIVLKLRGIQSIRSAADLQVYFGLDMFLRNQELNIPLKAFLSSINLFSIWWIILVILGLSIITEISKSKATLIAVSFWLFSTMIQVGFASLLGSVNTVWG